jgi:hypothetical protein
MPKYTIDHPLSLYMLVTVDGIKSELCIEADTDAGYVIEYEYDSNGVGVGTRRVKKIMVDGYTRIAPPVKRKGKVEVKLKPNAPQGAKL